MRTRRVEVAAAFLAVALALLPLVVAAVTRIGSDWIPIHDVAVTDMRVRDVWTADVPLVGPYSRYLWNHPGPILFWMMALPSALSGQAAWGTLVGGVLVQAVAVVWAAVLAWRVGRLPTVLVTMAVVLLTFRAIGPLVVLEPWNPHVALPWFVLYVLYAWRLSLGELRRLPGAVFVASFLVQTHVGYLPLVAAGAAVVLAFVIVDRRRSHVIVDRRRSHVDTDRLEPVGWRPFALAGAVAVLVWAPVVVDQLTGSPGNITRLWDYFSGAETDEPIAGTRAAVRLVGAAFAVPPPWLGGAETHDFLTDAIHPGPAWLILVPVALVAVGLYGTIAARRRDHQRYVVLVAALLVAGVGALSRVTGDLLEYLFYWRIPLAVLVVAAGGVGVVDLVLVRARDRSAERSPTVATAAGAVALGVLLILSVATSAAVATHGAEVKPFEREVAAVLAQIDLDEIDETVLVRFDGSTTGGLQGGLVDALDREDVRVRVDQSLDFQFGEHRAAAPADVDEIWYATEEGWLTSLRTSDPNGRVVARLEPLGPEKEGELVALQLDLLEQLDRAGRRDLRPALDSDLVAFALQDVDGVDLAAAERLGELNAELRALESCRCAVVAFPPDRAPTPPPG